VAQADLELAILLPQALRCWVYRHGPPCPARSSLCILNTSPLSDAYFLLVSIYLVCFLHCVFCSSLVSVSLYSNDDSRVLTNCGSL
jgi:hypothetical protein